MRLKFIDFFVDKLTTFGHPFTPTQERAATLLAHFVTTPRADAACILRGYAGTGKTSLVGALVKVMRMLKREVVLLAPTGGQQRFQRRK